MTIFFSLCRFLFNNKACLGTSTTAALLRLQQQRPSLFYCNNVLFAIMVSTRKKTTTVKNTTTVTTTVKEPKAAVKAGTKRSVSPATEEEVIEEEKNVKKVKSTTSKKRAWEPFDPSLPNNMTFPTEFKIPAKPEKSIKIASYNVASLAACIKKGFNTYVVAEDADILCVQETKLNQPLSTAVNDKVYKYRYWSFDEKKGYGKRNE